MVGVVRERERKREKWCKDMDSRDGVIRKRKLHGKR